MRFNAKIVLGVAAICALPAIAAFAKGNITLDSLLVRVIAALVFSLFGLAALGHLIDWVRLESRNERQGLRQAQQTMTERRD